MFDITKTIFISQNCMEEEKSKKRVLKILNDFKIPAEKVIEGIKIELVLSGDYLIRCVNGTIRIFEIFLKSRTGEFETKMIGEL